MGEFGAVPRLKLGPSVAHSATLGGQKPCQQLINLPSPGDPCSALPMSVLGADSLGRVGIKPLCIWGSLGIGFLISPDLGSQVLSSKLIRRLGVLSCVGEDDS